MNQIVDMLKRNSLLLALVVVMVLFEIAIQISGHGSMFSPQNFTNIISQNSYVIILAVGMLFCIIGCGNIDLSVGSIVALIGAVAGVIMVNNDGNVYMAIAICLLLGILNWCLAWLLDCLCTYSIIHRDLSWYDDLPWYCLLVLDGLTISPFPPEYYVTSPLSFLSIVHEAFTLTTIVTLILVAVYIVAVIYDRVSKLKKNYEVETYASFIFKMAIVVFALVGSGFLLANNKGIPVILVLLTVIVLFYALLS